MSDVHVVVLAAGKGTRMKSALPKVLHKAGGLTLIEHVLRAVRPLGAASTTLVVGHGAEQVKRSLTGWPAVRFARQEPQLGTAHALAQVEPLLEGARGQILVLSGDVPRLRSATLARLSAAQRESRAPAVLLTAIVEHPYGYGRLIRDHGRVVRIVEERDASDEERKIREINAGVYAFALEPLFDSLRAIAPVNAQDEYYLPDLIAIYARAGRQVDAVAVDDAAEIQGINSRSELAEVSRAVRQSKNDELMAAGVTIEDPATTYVDPGVNVGPDTVIHPGVHLQGHTHIGAGCEIGPGVRILDSTLGDGVVVLDHSVIAGSRVGSGAQLGPFAHLRPETVVGEGARIGNFVELKKTAIGRGSKANHLSYLGDATIGEGVNVGAGTITCNYDGRAKHHTIIEDGAFIGSDSQLVAPVRVGSGAYVAAGSCITEDVPADTLGIARARQVNREGWPSRRRTGAESP
jgi:bifunctional UDP-N-acetylglucosamine pyrophosphorylase/glucosamine-1-phosphate N-acetyltransferase